MIAAVAVSQNADDPLAGLEVREMPKPDVPQGWSLVKVVTSSINMHDVWTLRGVGHPPELLPRILGCDAAGYDEDGNRVVVHGIIGDLDRGQALAPPGLLEAGRWIDIRLSPVTDVDELAGFLEAARLDVVGVFGYSDEDGTEGMVLDGKVDQVVIDERVARITDLVEELTAQRAADRIGDQVRVLVEEVDEEEVVGRTAEQGPEIDGVTLLELPAGAPPPSRGDLVDARVVGSEGVDLVAVPR